MMKPARVVLALAAFALMASCRDDDAVPVPAAGGAPATAASAQPLDWAVGGTWRLDSVKARDTWRHPVTTLSFFGLKPTDTVVEIWPGGGYWTAILGPWLKAGGGKLVAAHPESPEAVAAWNAAYGEHPETYGDITVTTASKTAPGLAADGSADAILTFRNIHNWMAGGYADKIFADAFRALKPGGVLGVEEHRLPSARDQDLTASTGYVLESYVVQVAQNAGFVLEESSEINANPKDNADHPLGVWMLPPNLRAPAPGSPEAAGYDKARYTAIGESDRMTLRFRKPAAAAASPAPAAAAPPAQ
ncbi:MAG: class I SAM-dependent methyltransferase [Hyphomonadaceae bacterium]|nr:class I SAM-dependent methyltransferase [Hyphomonadaceae bacterium]